MQPLTNLVLLPPCACGVNNCGLQAQQVHGNRWTLIASQLLPWRLPIELRTVCLAKTPDEWAVSNSYLSAGFTLDLLLANSPPEYKAQWQAFWACRQQQQAAAGVSPESQVRVFVVCVGYECTCWWM